MKTDQDQIIAAALDILKAGGLDGLSMRALAARLGVRASALYWHVADKDRLYALMAGHFYRSAYEGARGAADARAWLAALGREFRAGLLAFPDSARLCAMAPPVADHSPETRSSLARQLVGFGLDEERALNAIASVLALTLGWVVYEQSSTMHDHLAGMLNIDQAYEAGLRASVEGMAPEGAPEGEAA